MAVTSPAVEAEAGGPVGGARQAAIRALLIHPAFLRIVSFGLALAAWDYAGQTGMSPAFPGLRETTGAFLEMTFDGSLPQALLVTLHPLALGLLISGTLGVGLGVLMGLSRAAEWLASPVVIILQAAPLAALIPILTFAYGIGLTSKVFVVGIMAIPVIVLNSFNSVRHTPGSLIEMGRSFQAGRAQLILKIILPSASPLIFAGLRLGAAAGFVGAILAELLITPTGIGDLITYNQSIADYPKMYAAIVAVIVFSVLFIELLERIEILFFRPEKRARR